VAVSVTRGGSGADTGALAGGDADIGYRGPTACAAAGITYRQLDYWARTGLVEPSVRPAHGSGSQRLYSFRDILVLKVVKRLLDLGISLQQIRAAVRHLRDRGTDDLAEVTLMSDGVSVYELTSPDEVVDLLAGGQGVFGIALGRVWEEVAGELAELPAVRAEDGLIAGTEPDELATRRARRTGLSPGSRPSCRPAGCARRVRHGTLVQSHSSRVSPPVIL
jgi:DNA-binding transcriptional MerR regulator